MPPFAGLARIARTKVTIKRNMTSTSQTGATKFNWHIIAEHVACALVDNGGRMRQTEAGQVGGRKATAIFPPQCLNMIQENDLVMVEPCGQPGSRTYKAYHVFLAQGLGGPSHFQVNLEVWSAAGDP